uniref:Uncharacterized protein n=2 Tax=Setaria TaxID=4554 RepID=K3XNH5_SETIT|nr:hypothetical protein SEVIR_5G278350v2 [Setaria viridis]
MRRPPSGWGRGCCPAAKQWGCSALDPFLPGRGGASGRQDRCRRRRVAASSGEGPGSFKPWLVAVSRGGGVCGLILLAPGEEEPAITERYHANFAWDGTRWSLLL